MSNQKTALVCGAGGFIGGHLVKRLKDEGYRVRGVDIKQHEHRETCADEFVQGDLREQSFCRQVTSGIHFDELYQLAADMGGAGYIFTGEHDAAVMHNSATINLNMAEEARKRALKRFSILQAPVFIRQAFRKMRIIPDSKRQTHIRQALTANKAGKNSLVRECIYPMPEIMEWKYTLPVFTIFSAHSVHGKGEKKKPLPQ